jgi:nucleotide-binding universal stress UspA family protein
MNTYTSVPSSKWRNPAQRRPSKVGAVVQPRSLVTDNAARQPGELKRILVPTDCSRASNKALKDAVSLAPNIGIQITLIHVIKSRPIESEPYPVWLGFDPRLAKAECTLLKVCREQHVHPPLLRNTVVREGTPHREITKAARDLQADLIIIATNGRTGLAQALLGSTTERVVRRAPCPVLVVREKDREFIHD